MNWSMYTADRTTHLKIVLVGLAAALLISVIAVAGQFNLGTDIMTAQGPTVIKAGADGAHRPQPSGYPLEVTRAPAPTPKPALV